MPMELGHASMKQPRRLQRLLSRQVLFDMGAARSVCPSTFRPDIPTEPPKEIPLHQSRWYEGWLHFRSKFLNMGMGNHKIEGTFDVRNVTKPNVAAGQVTDKGQGVWLSSNGGYILDMRSAKKIESLLGDKSSFIELKKQKGVYVIPCDDPSSSLFPLVEKESKQTSQVDDGDVELEADRPARVKGAPVLPYCDIPKLVRGVCGRSCKGRFSQEIDERFVGATGDNGATDSLVADTEKDLATNLVLRSEASRRSGGLSSAS